MDGKENGIEPNKVIIMKHYYVYILTSQRICDDIGFAIQREKRFKRWKREQKIALIEKDNPNWIDLYKKIKQ